MKPSRVIRQEFIEFFKDHGHTFVPSSAVVLPDDPTLMFANAGMNQFKDVFLETGTRPYKRAVNSQKCIRAGGKHNDLDEVGHDNYHHTYFEMLGNWSFGDYFKKEAIRWAWELLTEKWGIPKDRLYVTVFAGDEEDDLVPDEEAEALWQEVTEVDPTHILRFGKKDNFWEMGETGPCGPCSEIHIDMTPDRSGGNLINADDPRVIEIWNLVFIQFNRFNDGHLEQLPSKHIDTGMGFERVVRILQGVDSNYETDIFVPIITKIQELVGIEYSQASDEEKSAFHVIADHVRMLTFSISDGVMPSNEDRGYVLRRILRRAARYGRKLNMEEPFIYQVVDAVVAVNGTAFGEIVEKAAYVKEIIRTEEVNFNKTLDRGLEIFEKVVEELGSAEIRTIPGEDAFRLYDTFGFPLDLTRILAEEKGMMVDESGFAEQMEQQRERSRQEGKFSAQDVAVDDWIVLVPASETTFVGYDRLKGETQIHKYAKRGDQFHVILLETPFYAESGGQVGDRGRISGDGFDLEVIDTQKGGGHHICICLAADEPHIKNANVTAAVNALDRGLTTYNHTSTHLLHAALRQVLGDHVQQAGSLVAPDYLRFDFTHSRQVSREELAEIEQIINQKVQENIELVIENTDFKTAKAKGAMALFGEKYGDIVRVVTISPFSVELCGGCHVKHTGQIGAFIITQESSVASGVRRIEAISGPRAIDTMQVHRDILLDLSRQFNVSQSDLLRRVTELTELVRQQEKEIQRLQAGEVLDQVDQLLQQAEQVGDISVVLADFNDIDVDVLKQLADEVRNKSQKTVGFFVNHVDGRLNFVLAITDDLIKDKKLNAGDLVRQAAKIAGGGGGGRPHLATAGAKSPEKLPEVLDFIRGALAKV